MKNGLAFMFVYLLLYVNSASAGLHQNPPSSQVAKVDSTQTRIIRNFFADRGNLELLKFPVTVFRVYQNNGVNLLWVNNEQLADALSLLQCVAQYGLNPKYYHTETFNNATVGSLNIQTNTTLRAKSDILLTDAILTLIVQLHYGMANPYYPATVIDEKEISDFKPDLILLRALKGNFRRVILDSQPDVLGYKFLQAYLQSAVLGLFNKCSALDNDTLKVLALNMERYKWQATKRWPTYIEINIPSFTLYFTDGGLITPFKVIVGKPVNPSPQLVSAIDYLNTAPDWNVPARIFTRELLPKILRDPSYLERNNFVINDKRGNYISPTRSNLNLIKSNPANYSLRQLSCCDNALGQIKFHFGNPYSVYLHDTPEKSLFNRENRALSHGCIRVQNPPKLVSLLLKATRADPGAYTRITRAMSTNQKYLYTFNKPVPIIISYLTCQVTDGTFVSFPDVYERDKALSMILFD